jgi:probable rRNA maturation factor
MSVAVTNFQRARKINLRLLKKITGTLLVELEVEEAELAICLVDKAEMTRINETFLQHGGSTDVITFDYSAPQSGTRDVTPKIHGEIFACVDEAIVQARKFNTNWQSEIVRYVVHGVLHLTGHDDRRLAARKKMKREENRLLAGLSHRFSLAQLSLPVRISA